MKTSTLVLAAISILVIGASAQAAPVTYLLSVTNGSQMPLSPSVVYVKPSTTPAAAAGTESTPGLVGLCQMGKAADRKTELLGDKTITFATTTSAMLFPGETAVIEVEVADLRTESIHFETMYGKTKDVCGTGLFTSHSLIALSQHVTSGVREKDSVIQTGAFLDPSLPAGTTYLDPAFCAMAADSVSCLRDLALPNAGRHTIRFFSGYLPSLTMALETKYGAAEAEMLVIPTSGAIQFDLKLKH